MTLKEPRPLLRGFRMLSLTNPAFISIPNPQNQRVLHEAVVLELDGRRVVLEIAGLSAAPEGEVTLFAEVRGKFFQQGATVTVVRQASPLQIEFHTVGDPVSAEQRGSHRTSVIAMEIPVGIDKIAGCVLADVSPEGVGVICPKSLTVGTTVHVSLMCQGIHIDTPLRVQTVKILPSGKLRFGLFLADKRSPARAQLQKLAGLMQRLQLKRLSGAA